MALQPFGYFFCFRGSLWTGAILALLPNGFYKNKKTIAELISAVHNLFDRT